jgi:cell division protein FtsB
MGSVAAIAVPVGLSLLGGGTQVQAANNQRQAIEASRAYNQAVADRNSKLIRFESQQNIHKVDKEASKRLGRITTAVGASGVLNAGSAISAARQSEREADIDRRMIIYNQNKALAALQDSVSVMNAQAQDAINATYWQSMSAILNTASSIGGMFMRSPTMEDVAPGPTSSTGSLLVSNSGPALVWGQ